MGGLHTIMSFLGSIGYVMANSGLSEALETLYAKNIIEPMMSGKAIARAIRAHFIVDAVLTSLLLERGLKNNGDPMQVGSDTEMTPDLEREQSNQGSDAPAAVNELIGEMETAYKNMMDGQPVEDLCKSSVVEKTKEILKTETDSLTNRRTAKLWIQYMKMIDILRRFLRGEQLGN